MNDCVYWGSANSSIYPASKLLAYRATPCSKEPFHNMGFIGEEAQRSYTALRFPRKAEDYRTQQIQQMNYDVFIRTMADLIKKYTPKIQN